MLLSFAGRNTLGKKAYRVREAGVLDGVVIRIGGRDNTIPVWLKDADGAIYKCEANRDMARELAAYYLEAPVRVTGQGDWLRSEGGVWLLEKFRISGFEALDQTAIPDILNVVRLAQGNGWNELDDPVHDHLKMRSSE